MAKLRTAQYAGLSRATHLPSYISGYFDGEGCFTVSFSRRPKLRVGWETRPSVSVSQNNDRSEVLYEIAQYFGCGSIRPDRSDKTLKWETRKLSELRRLVLPHFKQFRLRSAKQADVDALSTICDMIADGEHLDPVGLAGIVGLAAEMNPSGKRRYPPDEILQTLEMKA